MFVFTVTFFFSTHRKQSPEEMMFGRLIALPYVPIRIGILPPLSVPLVDSESSGPGESNSKGEEDHAADKVEKEDSPEAMRKDGKGQEKESDKEKELDDNGKESAKDEKDIGKENDTKESEKSPDRDPLLSVEKSSRRGKKSRRKKLSLSTNVEVVKVLFFSVFFLLYSLAEADPSREE